MITREAVAFKLRAISREIEMGHTDSRFEEKYIKDGKFDSKFVHMGWNGTDKITTHITMTQETVE